MKRDQREMLSVILWWASLIYLAVFWWAAGALIWHIAARASDKVDVALILAVDHSHSVDDLEWKLQIKGYADALRSDHVAAALEFGGAQRVAITMFQWAGDTSQHVFVPWTVVASRDDLMRLADTVEREGLGKVGASCTSLNGAMRYAEKLFTEMPYVTTKPILDISGDGSSNCGSPDPAEARERLMKAGVTINGLPIQSFDETEDIAAYYQRAVIGGRGAFMIEAKGWQEFSKAIQMKLAREISAL